MGKVMAINISSIRGIEKTSIEQVELIKDWGLQGDAHGGDWDRQVSIFPVEALEKVPPEKKEEVLKGGYTENFTISGIELSQLAIGNFVAIGKSYCKIIHIGKDDYKEHGRPYIVSREGRFSRVIKDGTVKLGDEVIVYPNTTESFLQCVQEGILTAVQVFLNEGMDTNVRDIYDATPLMLAARNGDAAIVQALLNKGADINAKSDDRVTALMVAAYAGHTEIVRMLLDASADPNVQSNSGMTALLLAKQGNNNNILRLLERAGVKMPGTEVD